MQSLRSTLLLGISRSCSFISLIKSTTTLLFVETLMESRAIMIINKEYNYITAFNTVLVDTLYRDGD